MCAFYFIPKKTKISRKHNVFDSFNSKRSKTTKNNNHVYMTMALFSNLN